MNTFIALTLLATSGQFNDSALNDYQDLSAQLITETAAAESAKEVALLSLHHEALVQKGVEILKLYAEKNPNCAVQLETMLSELPAMPSLSTAQVFERYHDAVGLPEAPFHCIYGRVYVVHPVMNQIRANSGAWDTDLRDDALADLQESVHYLPKLQINLNTPPN